MSALVLTRRDIEALMTPADYLTAVELAFAAGKDGRASSPPPLHLSGVGGDFHAKAAILMGAKSVAALKFNGNFPGNSARGLPTIQGAILLCDAENGSLLAVMDSIEITLRRTAAATALAARHLARADSTVLSICGCGAQARPQAEALAKLFAFKRGHAWDMDEGKAASLARDLEKTLRVPFKAVDSMRAATRASDIIVTCTTARAPFLGEADVSPGVFIAAVGADNPAKSEIAPALMAKARVVPDVLEQCLVMGDLNHAVRAGAIAPGQIEADLGDIVTGVQSGRTRAEEIIIFDSTGTALQDVASAALAYERAVSTGVGMQLDFA